MASWKIGVPGAAQLLAALHPLLGRARRIGITGPQGAGKSTITTRLAELYRRNGLTVGIVAVDPTSPFTGGALLGDRIRMESVALDEWDLHSVNGHARRARRPRGGHA